MARRMKTSYAGSGGYHSPEGFRDALSAVWWRPNRFFRGLDPEGGPLRPALFAAGVLYVNLVLGALLDAVWLRELNPVLLYVPVVGLVVAVVLGPLFVAGLTALSLMISNPDNSPTRGFLRTFRAYGFVSAIAVVLWIPYAPLLAVPYGLYVATVAMKETNRLSWQQAVLAALAPLGAILFIILLLTGPSDAWQLLRNMPGTGA
jgi:hypothetical protein